MRAFTTKRKILYTIYAIVAIVLIVSQVKKYSHSKMIAQIVELDETSALVCAVEESGEAIESEQYVVNGGSLPEGAKTGDLVKITYVGIQETDPAQFDYLIAVELVE
ncbi:MAG: hypothetical protein Q4F79_10840 [Eubacteriales bacterium]|nr:hypothetical protein [Eubacteriales bacterium]